MEKFLFSIPSLIYFTQIKIENERFVSIHVEDIFSRFNPNLSKKIVEVVKPMVYIFFIKSQNSWMVPYFFLWCCPYTDYCNVVV